MDLHDLTNGDSLDRRLLMENLRKIADSVRSTRVAVTAPSVANQEFTVPHGLSSVPTGFTPVSKDRECTVYASGTAFDQTNAYLKSSVADAVLVIEFSPGRVL